MNFFTDTSYISITLFIINLFLSLILIINITNKINKANIQHNKTNIQHNKTNTNNNVFQYLLEKPTNFQFDSTYLNSIVYTSSPLIECLHKYCKDNSVYTNGAIVSLSGGVDSMVLLAILIHLKQTYNFPIYTASIDYGLRPESNDESKFLIKYTEMFGIKSYILSLIHI